MREGMGERISVQRHDWENKMDAELLWETTMDPKNRTLIRVNLDDAEKADEYFSIFMGDEVEPRKNYIIDNANFADLDI